MSFFCFRLLPCFAFGCLLSCYASADLLFGGVTVEIRLGFWGDLLAMSVNSVNGVMWEISEIEGLILAMDWVRVRVIAIFFKHFDQECIFSLKYGFCKIFIKDIETYLLGIALFTYISARFNQNNQNITRTK